MHNGGSHGRHAGRPDTGTARRPQTPPLCTPGRTRTPARTPGAPMRRPPDATPCTTADITADTPADPARERRVAHKPRRCAHPRITPTRTPAHTPRAPRDDAHRMPPRTQRQESPPTRRPTWHENGVSPTNPAVVHTPGSPQPAPPPTPPGHPKTTTTGCHPEHNGRSHRRHAGRPGTGTACRPQTPPLCTPPAQPAPPPTPPAPRCADHRMPPRAQQRTSLPTRRPTRHGNGVSPTNPAVAHTPGATRTPAARLRR
ncbi:hypothetical protein QE410_000863 [Microbacterium sp. SORGH_AS 1204]|nr:hypothetical protein [Microbacterium sp. SORGH_AS_1204]